MAQTTALHDPLSPLTKEFLENPYPTFERLRNEAPAFWSEKGKYWIVSRYAEANAILRDTHYEKQLQRWRQVNPLVKMLPMISDMLKSRAKWMLNMDPPDHTRMRSLVNKAFTPSMVSGMRPHIENIANTLLDEIQKKGEMDVVSDYAFLLPVTVIAEMLGVPAADRERFKSWSHALTATLEPTLDIGKITHAYKANEELIAYLRPLVAERRQKPQNDLISSLVQAEEEGNKLTEDELLNNCILILVAGHETTVNLIGNSIYLLSKHGQQRELLKQKPELTPKAIAEFLRYESPVQMMRRLAGEDTELGGKTIREGDMIIVLIGSANRDAAAFERPDELDIEREVNKHLAFGLGIHHCLGSSLAEAEGEIAISTFLKRIPNFQLKTDKLEHREPFALRGFKSLPITFA